MPIFLQNLCAVQNVAASDAIDGPAGTNTICIIGILNIVKGLQLPTLLPNQGMTQVVCGIALGIVGDSLTTKTGKEILPVFVTINIFYAFLPRMSMGWTMLL